MNGLLVLALVVLVLGVTMMEVLAGSSGIPAHHGAGANNHEGPGGHAVATSGTSARRVP